MKDNKKVLSFFITLFLLISMLPQPINAKNGFCHGARQEKYVALTFDDGPSVRTTEVLNILKEKNVKATFFVVGSSGQASEQLLQRIVE